MANENIVLGGGCFWCTEAVFELFKGVVKTEPGYAGGSTSNPTYDEVCTDETGHAEVLSVEYNPSVISLDTLLEIFFTMHDPTSLNRQGNDAGTQYRSAIYYTSNGQKAAIDKFIKSAQQDYDKPIVTEVKKLDRFYPAEEYHKKYYDKNPYAGYCSFVISPKVAKVKKKFASLLK